MKITNIFHLMMALFLAIGLQLPIFASEMPKAEMNEQQEKMAAAALVIKTATEALDNARNLLLTEGTTQADDKKNVETIIKQVSIIVQAGQQLKTAEKKAEKLTEEEGYLNKIIAGVKKIGAAIIAPFRTESLNINEENEDVSLIIEALVEQQREIKKTYLNLGKLEQAQLRSRYAAIMTQLTGVIFEYVTIQDAAIAQHNANAMYQYTLGMQKKKKLLVGAAVAAGAAAGLALANMYLTSTSEEAQQQPTAPTTIEPFVTGSVAPQHPMIPAPNVVTEKIQPVGPQVVLSQPEQLSSDLLDELLGQSTSETTSEEESIQNKEPQEEEILAIPTNGDELIKTEMTTESEQLAQERLEQEARELAEKEAAERVAQERLEQEARELAEKEVAERAAQERLEQEARELAEKEVAERVVQERLEQEARELAEKEAAERVAQERLEQEARELAEKEAAERVVQERLEQEARELTEKEAAERAAQERLEQEARELAEKEAAERVAQERLEQEARELAEKEAAERVAQERLEQEARELAEKEVAERAAQERLEQEARELAEKEAAERLGEEPTGSIVPVMPELDETQAIKAERDRLEKKAMRAFVDRDLFEKAVQKQYGENPDNVSDEEKTVLNRRYAELDQDVKDTKNRLEEFERANHSMLEE